MSRSPTVVVIALLVLIVRVGFGQITLHTVVPQTLRAGSPSTLITMCGKGLPGGSFAMGSRVEWVAANGAVTLLGYTTYIYTISSEFQTVTMPVPASLLVTPGACGVRWVAVFAGTTYSPTYPITVVPSLAGPVVGGLSPQQINYPGLLGIAISVSGSGFTPSSQVHFDATPAPTTFIDSSTLTAVVNSTCPGANRTGGIAVSVVDSTQVVKTSNATTLSVYTTGLNLGLLSLTPPNAGPGNPITFTIGGVGVTSYILLVASAVPTSSVYPWPTFIEQQVMGLDLSSTSIIINGFTQGVVTTSIPSTGGGGGAFAFPATYPSPPLGQTMSFQAAFLDPSSSMGFRLTNALHGLSF